MHRCSLLVLSLFVSTLALLAYGCDSQPPEGRLACTTDADCPSTWHCRSDHLCYRDAAADGGALDGATPDARVDGGPGAGDAGAPDAGARDAGADTSTPDAGSCAGPADCDDGDMCTTDACTAGRCAHDAVDCDDGRACTVDSCSRTGGCAHVADDGVCGSGRSCSPASADADADGCVPGTLCTTAAMCDDGLFCTDDACDATSGRCAHQPHPCSEDTNPCTDGAACDETADTCVPAFARAGTPCRASVDVCDAAESCTGSSVDCPPDAFAGPSVACRASRGECDAAELCTGTGPHCPSDMPAGDGTPCDLRCGAETCIGFTCSGGTTCSALNVCLCGDEFCGPRGTPCP